MTIGFTLNDTKSYVLKPCVHYTGQCFVQAQKSATVYHFKKHCVSVMCVRYGRKNVPVSHRPNPLAIGPLNKTE